MAGGGANDKYVGARGLPPEFIKELEVQFADKSAPERFLTMMWNYMRFDFGQSYFRSISVVDLVVERCRCRSHWVCGPRFGLCGVDPAGHPQGGEGWHAFDTWTSGAIIVGYAIPGFLFAVMLIVLFAGGSYWRTSRSCAA